MPIPTDSTGVIDIFHIKPEDKANFDLLWRRSLPESEITEQEASLTVSRTMDVVNTEGFCLWTCHQLDDAVICVIKNLKTKVKTSYPVYTIRDLEILSECNSWTQRMVLEAKKCTKVVVTKVISRIPE
jgi:hypothetical protein